MSELIQKHDNRATIRWKLLTGVSVLALTAYVSSAAMAKAEDAAQPQVWIELGGALDRLQDSQELFEPPFLAKTPSIFTPPQKAERPPLFGFDENAALTFQPEGSDWLFSASIRYGRASSGKHVHHETYPSGYLRHKKTGAAYPTLLAPIAARFTDARAKQSEDHTILDFQAGKDLGLGLFGRDISSFLNLGVRVVQFTSKSQNALEEDPDWYFHHEQFHHLFGAIYVAYVVQPYHTYQGSFRADRSFDGVGPSLSWKSSVPFAGNSQNSELTLDLGLNGALLFGRQKSKTHHQTTARYHVEKTWKQAGGTIKTRHITYEHPATPDHTRMRNVTVPNVGGFAAISFKYDAAKVSFGYKADFFFGAIDGGIDVAKNENRAFYGPYASISIGIGD